MKPQRLVAVSLLATAGPVASAVGLDARQLDADDAEAIVASVEMSLVGSLLPAEAGTRAPFVSAQDRLGPAAPSGSEEAVARLETTVRPGGVVRWPGEGITRCGMSGEKWDPVDGACWYPVDLEAPEGGLELGRWVEGVLETTLVRIGPYPYTVQRLTIEDESKVFLSEEDLARVRQENARIGRLWATSEGPRRFTLPLGDPLDEMPGGGRFGARRIFNDVPRSPHSGVDYSAPAGTPVRSVAGGRVALVGDFFFSGKSVFVDHGGGLVSMYFHLSEIGVEEGEEIERGDRIGAVGATGRATGPHLHFGIRWHGRKVDPELLLGPPSEVPVVGETKASR